MKILLVSGAGILPEQRIHRWKMVSSLYADLGRALRLLGHQTYFYVHPEALSENLPPNMTWIHPDHSHFGNVLDQFEPDFVFCWNGSSSGDQITASLAAASGAQMVYSEQGWFPQSNTIYFDMTGTNARCGTRHKSYKELSQKDRINFINARNNYIDGCNISHLYTAHNFRVAPPDPSKPIFVPLQDERDLNIVKDSPFKTMDAFLGYLSNTWPELQFRVRPHPKFPHPKLSYYSNVEMDDPKQAMFESLASCGMVMGINSTTLLESALLGKTVVAFGESLASGTGVFFDAKPGDAFNLENVEIKTSTSEAVLFFLLKKQFSRDSLSDPALVMKSKIFSEMRVIKERQNLHSWM